jgi:hypothetical protein
MSRHSVGCLLATLQNLHGLLIVLRNTSAIRLHDADMELRGALPSVAMAYLSSGVSGDTSDEQEAKTSVSIFST